MAAPSQSIEFTVLPKDLNHEIFSKMHESEGWMGRKVMALPKALWSGVVMAIYDLLNMIFGGLIGLVNGDGGDHLIASAFSLARDVQKAAGHLIQIFHDSYGSYHVSVAETSRLMYAVQLDALNAKRLVENNLPTVIKRACGF